MPCFAGGHFKRDAFFFGERGNIHFGSDAFDAKFCAKVFDKGLIGVSFRTANGMVQVRGGQFVSEAMEDMKQCNGIGAAGDTDDD